MIPAFVVKDFRERHRLRQEDVDRLFGSASGGKSCARWERSGAPAYVGILMAYIDACGIAMAERLAAQRDLEG